MMSEYEPSLPVSEIYQPQDPNQLVDEPITPDSDYEKFGYTIAYELDREGIPVPEGGNTAVFRIPPGGLTEPVFVTKPEADSTFTVTVLQGQGRLILAREDGQVEETELATGSEVVVRPGDAYTYVNTGDNEDLLLHDVARPAFKAGDEVKLYVSAVPEHTPRPEAGFSTTIARTSTGELRQIDLPTRFFNLLSDPSTPKNT